MVFLRNSRHTCAKRMLLSVALVLSIMHSGVGQAQSSDRKVAALVPVIMSLLDGGPILLTVGESNSRVYESRHYPNEIQFQTDRIYEDVTFTINMEGIAAGTQLEIYINGELAGTLQNGENVFTIEVSERDKNNIVIKLRDGTTGSWTITGISAFLKTGPTTYAQAQQFLSRATFGPKKAELDRVLEIGYAAWIDEQLALPRRSNLDAYRTHLANRQAARRREIVENDWRQDSACKNDSRVTTQQQCIDKVVAQLEGSLSGISRMDVWWQGAIDGRDQLRERVIYALSQIMVLSDVGNDSLWQRGMTVYMDILSKHAFGNYEELLKDVTLNNNMGRYLSLSSNIAANSNGRGGRPDENYAREVMQLFSIGLIELNKDGTPLLGADGKEIDTYTPDTVRALSRALTGWRVVGSFFEQDLNPLIPWGEFHRRHDQGEKILFKKRDGTFHVNPAGLSTTQDLDRALNGIFNHANVPPFIATRLIERLVMSNPSPAYVERVANVFIDNGSGVRGDLGAVVKAILLDPEAFDSPNNPRGGKIKEPIIALSQVWRAFNARSDIGTIRYSSVARTFAQRPFSSRTVFNFYPPTGTTVALGDHGLVAPEITLLQDPNILLLLQLMRNIATSATAGSDPISGTSYDSRDTRRAMILNLSEPKALAHDHQALMDFYEERLFGGQMTDELRQITINYLEKLKDQGSDNANRRHVSEQALNIILVSPEYYFQR